MTTETLPRQPFPSGRMRPRTRALAAVAGALYLVTFVSSIPAALLLSPVLTDPGYIVGAGVDAQIALANVLDLVNALAAIGTAVAVFPVIRRVGEAPALGFVTTRLFEAAVIVIGVVALFAVVTLRTPDATGSDAATLTTVGTALVAVRDWTFLIGPGLMPGFNALLFGAVLYRSRLVPRWIPLLGLIGGPLLISSAVGVMIGINELGSPWSVIATAPIFVWELSVGVWMLVRGFRRPALDALGLS
jgi:hypothetical protein